jgi:hypothetical protein
MVGTTRSRVSHFMNRFRTLSVIEYADGGALAVNKGLQRMASCPSKLDLSAYQLLAKMMLLATSCAEPHNQS